MPARSAFTYYGGIPIRVVYGPDGAAKAVAVYRAQRLSAALRSVRKVWGTLCWLLKGVWQPLLHPLLGSLCRGTTSAAGTADRHLKLQQGLGASPFDHSMV